jgi:hypothetical protein
MERKPEFQPDGSLRLMEQVKQVLRYYHYAYRTEQTSFDWIVRYSKFDESCGSLPKPLLASV